MKIAYITEFDVKNTDKKNWRKNQLGHWACCYYIAKYLENEQTTLQYINSFHTTNALLPKIKRRFYHQIKHKFYHFWADPVFNLDYAAQISQKLLSLNPNIIFCPDINFIAYLNCSQPIVIWVDSTYLGYINFYPEYSNLCQETINHLTTMDKLALKKCKMVIFSSEWAAQNAIKNYQIEPEKVQIVPFGANIECNRTLADIQLILDAKSANQCKLLFIGSDWIRKGGNVALEVAKNLNSIGLNTQLTVVGCQPITKEPLPNFCQVIGFVDTSTMMGLNKIDRLFKESHFFILPSQADCTPHVLAEANSFGVPCLTTDIGGIPTMIKDGLNGKIFAINSHVSEYSKYISSLMTNYSEYKELALSSFNEYQTRLNWSAACQTVKQILHNLN